MRDFTELTRKQVSELAAQHIESEYGELGPKYEAFNERLANLCIEYIAGIKSIKDLEAYLDFERECLSKEEFVFREGVS